ncbi:MAG: DUF6095 family protein [Bacteroidota bacterium]|nr:DUF6095 family protein [Bacteroidota bacterium]MED5364046.1 DUF6095 family protein [Bacteroidota bacterium]
MKKVHIINGLKFILYAIFLAFLGPIILTSSFKNQDHPFFYPILGISLIICLISILSGFKGIKLLVKGFFNDNN